MSYLEAFADALQAPLRNAVCLDPRVNLDRLITSGIAAIGGASGVFYGQSLIWPTECGQVPAQTDAPFLDGQCTNVLYRVNVRTTFGDGTNRDIEFTNVVGPLRTIGTFWQEDFFGNLRAGPEIICPNDTQGDVPGRRRFGPWSSPIDTGRLARSFLISVVRQDGQPDNCGDNTYTPPPPPSPAPVVNIGPFTFSAGPFNTTVNATATFGDAIFAPSFGGINIPVNVTIAPNIIFPGGARLPVFLLFPSLNINAPISFFPINVQTITQEGGGTVELPYVERVFGVDCLCTPSPEAKVSLIAGDGNQPSFIFPRAGIVRFYVPGFLSLLVSQDVDIKSVQQFVQCPNPSGAVGYEILPTPGVSIVDTPVNARILETVLPV